MLLEITGLYVIKRIGMRKTDCENICSKRGFIYLTEDEKNVYLIDEIGVIHKIIKYRLNTCWKHNLQSAIKEDKKKYFINMAKSRHPNILDKTCFEGFEYILSTTYTTVKCLVHGEYKTKPSWILNNGHHCNQCGREDSAKSNKKSTEHFIKMAKKVHGSRYDYSNTVYNGSCEPLKIVCKKHGIFDIVAGYHTQGCGCQLCGLENGGYSKKDYISSCPEGSFVYLMNIKSKDEFFVKIGISKEPVRRAKEIKNKSDYQVSLLYTKFYEDAGVAWDVERLLHNEFKRSSYKPRNNFAGSTECFDVSIQDEVIKLLKCVA